MMMFLPVFIFVILSIIGFLVFFNRDPERIPPLKDAILSPADGMVIDVQTDEKWAKIIVFMNLANVHVQWVPYNGKIVSIKKIEGPSHLAYVPEAAKNKQVVTIIQTDLGEMVIKQIVGILARRIETFVKAGDKIKVGQRFGRILFGSRVELWLPKDKVNLVIQKKQKVLAGLTIVARPIK